MRKTLALINQQLKILKEQDQAMPPADPAVPEMQVAPAEPEITEPPPEPKQIEFTGTNENEYALYVILGLQKSMNELTGEQRNKLDEWKTQLETAKTDTSVREATNARRIFEELRLIITPDAGIESNLEQS
jgi:hypothetical protein